MWTGENERRQNESIISFLHGELERRQSAEPQYSLADYAEDLCVDQAMLSALMSGDQDASSDLLARALDPAGDPWSFEPVRPKFSELDCDRFQMIADWYHYAILELLSTHAFEPSPDWIARRLRISHDEAAQAVSRLFRLGFLAMDERGRWTNASGNNTTLGAPVTARAHREHQKQILENAIIAIDQVSITERDNSGVTLAIPAHKLPEARELIKTFRRMLVDILQPSPDQKNDSVYQLAIAFYPVAAKEPE